MAVPVDHHAAISIHVGGHLNHHWNVQWLKTMHQTLQQRKDQGRGRCTVTWRAGDVVQPADKSTNISARMIGSNRAGKSCGHTFKW